ncbi:MAG TPA: glucuronate isomerase [Gemmatimonadales bacterium]|nr:glucuronate isomerase [Gemmatimonadales bacterium]
MTAPGLLHEDRFFDSDPAVRRAARTLYEETRGLPLICPHGHVDAALLAANESFPEPTELILRPDHYILRMLYARGVPLEDLLQGDRRRAWDLFAEHYYLFRGTPSGAWLDHELHEVFGIRRRLSAETGAATYDEIAERLRSPEFRPRALFERFNIEVLATTDGPSDDLRHHQSLRRSGWKHGARVIPTFRPDAVFHIAGAEWPAALAALEQAAGSQVADFPAFVAALAARRQSFRQLGATATDHAVLEPYTAALDADEADRLFQAARRGEATPADEWSFEGNLLMEMARLSTEDGLVMQIHAGAWRDHNDLVFKKFGPDKGGDIPVATEFTRNLHALLNAYGNDPRFTLVLFTLDESTYSRELAPLAGHYPAVRLGPPWWFHDSMEGMRRFREQTTETAGIYKTAGFNDDTRAFCSIPARHDLARRMDANYLGGLVARHVVELDDARQMARALAYDLARETYRLGDHQ